MGITREGFPWENFPNASLFSFHRIFHAIPGLMLRIRTVKVFYTHLTGTLRDSGRSFRQLPIVLVTKLLGSVKSGVFLRYTRHYAKDRVRVVDFKVGDFWADFDVFSPKNPCFCVACFCVSVFSQMHTSCFSEAS